VVGSKKIPLDHKQQDLSACCFGVFSLCVEFVDVVNLVFVVFEGFVVYWKGANFLLIHFDHGVE
jgi:hypothetical protein